MARPPQQERPREVTRAVECDGRPEPKHAAVRATGHLSIAEADRRVTQRTSQMRVPHTESCVMALQTGNSDMRYRADITAEILKVTESRRIADLLLRQVDAQGWKRAIINDNILQARNPETAKRLARLIRSRLKPMGPELWRLVRDGKGNVATHAVLSGRNQAKPFARRFPRPDCG